MMVEMLTAKEMQGLLHVDRSTIYRMAEAGQLPALKIGKQWRFPRDQVQNWLNRTTSSLAPASWLDTSEANLKSASILPLDCCAQLIQDTFAEILEVMLVVTDLAGRPLTKVSHPCPVYSLLIETENGSALIRQKWQELGQLLALEPAFEPVVGGVLQARALIRLGNELKGMVIITGVAAADWLPSAAVIAEWVRSLQIDPVKLQRAFDSVVRLTPSEQKRVLLVTQRIADILAHLASERFSLRDRLNSIARLSSL
jgi:excisionase family DNA binding protein